MIQVYHNARCTKSRECLAFLENSGAEYEVIKYLESAPTVLELKEIIKKLGIKPIELVRQNELVWISDFKGRKLSDLQIIKAMAANPILIQRPIVVSGEKAVIARPLERAAEIF